MRARVGKWVVAILLLGLVLLPLLGREQKMKQQQITVTEEMRALGRLYNNYWRHLEEYDASNDERHDTLLWSREKTDREAEALLGRLFSQRTVLRMAQSGNLARQGRVERWGFVLLEGETIYGNVLRVASAFARESETIKKLFRAEIEAALQEGYYPEALFILREGYSVEEYGTYRSHFGAQAEGTLIDLLLLQEEYSTTLEPIEEKLSAEKVTDADQEWLRLMPPLQQRAEGILAGLMTTPYASEGQSIFDDCFGAKKVIIEAKDLNTATGVLKVNVFGIFPSGWELARQETKIALIPKGIVRLEVQDQLPKPGTYYYNVHALGASNGGYGAYMRYDKLYIYAYESQDNKVQLHVLDRATGSPVEGVVAKGGEQTKRSDQLGRITFEKKQQGYMVTVEDNRLAEPFSTYVPQLPETKSVEAGRTTQANFYLDRPLYRRGQTVKVGVVVSESAQDKEHTLPDYPLQLTLEASRGAEKVTVHQVTVTTNAQGVAETTFQLSEDANLTDYRISSKIGTEFIEVQDYKLSYLSVQIDSIPKGYVKGHPLVVMGKTTDLNGYPTSAQVLLEYGDRKRVEVQSGDDGLFTITTPKIAEYGYYIRLSASDALGNTAETQRYISTMDTDMPLDPHMLLKGDKQNKERFTLSTKQQPYTKRLLGQLNNRHIYAQLVNERDTIDLGALPIEGEQEFSLPQLASGNYRVRLSTTDGYGVKQVAETGPIYFYSPKDKQLVGEHLLWVTRIASGDILYGSSYDHPIYYYLEQEGRVVEQRVLQTKAGQLQRLSLPKGASGKVELVTVRHMKQETQTIELDEPDSEKGKAHFEGLKFEEKYLPGADFKKSIRVLDKAGKPLAKAPVIVTVFDKAVADAAGGSVFWELISTPQWIVAEPRAMMYTKAFDNRAFEESAVLNKVVTFGSAGATASDAPLRTNFVETAYFSALLVTDEEGKIDLSFTIPDTQTKYIAKLFAFTTNLEEQVMGEATFEVSTPLSIELSTPRFLTWGDVLNGEAVLRNTGDQPLTARYSIANDSVQLTEGVVEVPANGTVAVPFAIQATEGEVLRLQGRAQAGDVADGVKRVIPLRSNLSTYTVAQPISAYKQDEVRLSLPKMELSSTPLTLQLYLDPIQLLLSKLALAHRLTEVEELGLFGAVHYYAVYSRLQRYLAQHPEFADELRGAAGELEQVAQKPSTAIDRMADPKTLADFYRFITDTAKLQERLSALEQTVLSHSIESGGFFYSPFYREASPWLTHYVLSSLGGLTIKDAQLVAQLERSLGFLERELSKERSYYHDFVGYALIAHEYERPLPDFGKPMQQQVEWLQKNYQSTDNSTMIRYAEYSRIYEGKTRYPEVRRFIKDRSGFTFNDDEQLSLMLFLQKDEAEVQEGVVSFALKVKQNTLWYDRGILDVAEVILDKVKPTRIFANAALQINGQNYHLTPQERLTGAVTMAYPAKADQLSVSWSGIESDYVFGGLSYLVTEPSAKATPTGDKLKVEKQIFVRQVDSEGNQTFALAEHVEKGDKLIVRYLIEAEQDLSLVMLVDPRPATSEFGYQFEGYGRGGRFWWHYSRRDAEDRLYIDWLPRGRHQIELEAVASQGGRFTYGPAQIQSYYAPEYAGNSSGGTLDIH
ncbi:MG2 domain-containing protein [Porphyromonas levii]|uniref:alpha-2-macroglobulin family protein n=1 Tax=Porphyromonas levii TaxID=28114 RepID=UPI001B8D2B58|nr:alpha-2-macroglobulin family protein [Porphyromonas levii]MBR8712943.1 hypothetical protein [Porphyromonas levii]MBR8714990.1 hypothetical protein [Porphyromonas levii]MBR8727470.1 hypothetical protein [Porphyromonas levii]MBR8735810.1 hypothetical protein [Porphyromonas levii]MBR8777882.1 hypothetical protein [Porphyromonas levii]